MLLDIPDSDLSSLKARVTKMLGRLHNIAGDPSLNAIGRDADDWMR